MQIPVSEGHRGLFYNEEKTPMTVPSGGNLDEHTQAGRKKAVVIETVLTPGRCPLWGRRTPDVPGSTPGRLVYRQDGHE